MLSSVYSGPLGQNVRDSQGGYDYNPPSDNSGNSGKSGNFLKSLFGGLTNLLGSEGGLDLIGTIFSTVFNSKNVEATNEMNRYLANLQNSHNLRMWELNNEYNLPTNQIKRLLDAGLNPNLLYGNPSQGSSNAPAQGAAPPQMQAFQMPDIGERFSNMQQVSIQRKAMEAQVKLMEAEAEDKKADTVLKQKDAGTYDEKFEMYKRQYELELDNLEANSKVLLDTLSTNSVVRKKLKTEIDSIASQRHLTENQAFGVYLDNLEKDLGMDDRLRKLASECDLTEAEAAYWNNAAVEMLYQIKLGKIELSHAGIKDFYDTKMREYQWIYARDTLGYSLDSASWESKSTERYHREFNAKWSKWMRYVGATTGALGNIISGNAGYQFGAKTNVGNNNSYGFSVPMSKFKWRF